MENFDAYILKNTHEIVEELQKMGFNKSQTFDGIHPYIWISGDIIYETQNDEIEEVFNLINQQRQQNGLSALSINSEVQNVARIN